MRQTNATNIKHKYRRCYFTYILVQKRHTIDNNKRYKRSKHLTKIKPWQEQQVDFVYSALSEKPLKKWHLEFASPSGDY